MNNLKRSTELKFNFPYNIFNFLNLLSLDVVIGALLSGLMVSKYLEFNPGWAYWIVLPVSVWIIYTLDHVVDASRLGKNASTLRHRFTYRNMTLFIAVISVLSAVCLILVVRFLNPVVLHFGLWMGSISIIYLSIIYYSGRKGIKNLQKEIFVAMIYSMGIWGIPLFSLKSQPTTENLLFLVSFFLLAFSNTLILSFYEINTDRIDGHPSVTISMGRKKSNILIFSLLLISTFLSTINLFIVHDFKTECISIIFVIMALASICIMLFQRFLFRNYLYRYLTEIIFWLPGFFLFF